MTNNLGNNNNSIEYIDYHILENMIYQIEAAGIECGLLQYANDVMNDDSNKYSNDDVRDLIDDLVSILK